MLIFDAHCDTLEKIYDSAASGAYGQGLFCNDFSLDLKRLQYPRIQVFAVFTDPKYEECPGYRERAKNMLDKFYSELELNRDRLRLCLTEADLNAEYGGKCLAMLSLEGGDALEGGNDSVEVLREFYLRGVRSIALTWNNGNTFASGAFDTFDNGLTKTGEAVVDAMNELGMAVDISHLGHRSAAGVIEYSRKPVIASHSCSFYLNPHVRNISDENAVKLAEKGGVVGVNFYPEHLSANKIANIDTVAGHIEHLVSLIGPDAVGLGSDYDGISEAAEGLETADKEILLAEKLAALNYRSRDIENIMGYNFLRYYKGILM
ncbi:MAG: dipeptidase [Clostridiales bacterium]|jgi:membrane dipeptidase|nr:dipeptidase [Clostridiales bacterium]